MALLQDCGLNKGMTEPENGVCDSTKVVARWVFVIGLCQFEFNTIKSKIIRLKYKTHEKFINLRSNLKARKFRSWMFL